MDANKVHIMLLLIWPCKSCNVFLRQHLLQKICVRTSRQDFSGICLLYRHYMPVDVSHVVNDCWCSSEISQISICCQNSQGLCLND